MSTRPMIRDMFHRAWRLWRGAAHRRLRAYTQAVPTRITQAVGGGSQGR